MIYISVVSSTYHYIFRNLVAASGLRKALRQVRKELKGEMKTTENKCFSIINHT